MPTLESSRWRCGLGRMRDRWRCAERSGPWIARWGYAGAAGFLAALWIGLLLAEAGHFSAGVAWGAAMLAGGMAGWHCRPRGEEPAAGPGTPRSLLAAGALALFSLVFTIPPSEMILGGWDPGVYVHTAAVLAQEGSLRPEVPDLAALDADDRAQIGRQGQDAWEPFLGMRMLPNGRLSPQFYHLYPVLMALVWPLGGVKAALLANPLLNVLSILLMYLWACRWVRPRWAFGAALLLALNPAQVWQAGFSTAEMLAQCLLLVGLVATDRALSGGTKVRLDALLAGSAFGLMMLAKYEAMLFVVPFSVVLLAGLRDRSHRGALLLLLGVIAALGVHVGVHQIYFAPLYHPMGNWILPGLAAAGVAALLIGARALLFPRRTAEARPGAPAGRIGIRWLALAGFAIWIFLAGYVRPHLTVEGRVLTLFTRLIPNLNEAGWFAFLAGRNARNFWYLQSLFGVAGLLAALAGVGLLIHRTRTVWRTAWLSASVGVLVLLMTQISHEPFMMFVSRRMVPVILPLLCLGVAALCDRCEWAWRAHPRRGVLAGVLVLALPLAGTFGGTAYLSSHREWPGLADWLDALAAGIPRGAAVYSDAPGFAAPLRFLHGIPACETGSLSPGQRSDPMGLMRKQVERQPVFWLTQTPVPDAYAAFAAPLARFPLESVILGSTRHTVPRHTRPRGGTFTLYRIAPWTGSAADLAKPEGRVSPHGKE